MLIMLSVIFVCAAFWVGKMYYEHVLFARAHDDQYKVVALLQRCDQAEQLKSVCLAELMELSLDKPTNLYAFSSKAAREKLLASPLIKEATVKKIRPGTIYVNYQMRKPVAFLADVTNTALDEEGVAIPFHPFFTPKNLPKLVLGLTPTERVQWGKPLASERLKLALSVLAFIAKYPSCERCQLKLLDVSKIDAVSYGQRQLVIELEDRAEKGTGKGTLLCIYPRFLRLTMDDYQSELRHYFILQKYLLRTANIPEGYKDPIWKAPVMVIDLRIPQLAFISE
jgi:hypothetical protein